MCECQCEKEPRSPGLEFQFLSGYSIPGAAVPDPGFTENCPLSFNTIITVNLDGGRPNGSFFPKGPQFEDPCHVHMTEDPGSTYSPQRPPTVAWQMEHRFGGGQAWF